MDTVDSMSPQLKEMINISHLFLKRHTYGKHPTLLQRVLWTARHLLRLGVEDGQYIPDRDLYLEFKEYYFRRGGNESIDFENRWFFYYVRECIMLFRKNALRPGYEPWNDDLLDLGGPDSCDESEPVEHDLSTKGGHTVFYGNEVDDGGEIFNRYKEESQRDVKVRNEKW